MKRKDYHKKLMDEYNKLIQLRDCGNADHLTDENGDFKPLIEKPPKGHMSLGYLEEAMQWVYYHKEIPEDDKLRRIHTLETIAQKLLGEIKYKPHWSKKFITEHKTK